MITSYHRVANTFIALNAQHEVVGIIKSFEDSWKIDKPKRLKTKPREPTKGVEFNDKKKIISSVESQILENTRKRRLSRLNERKRMIK